LLLNLLAVSLAVAAQPAAVPPGLETIRQAVTAMGECHNAEANRRAASGTEGPDAVVAATFAACGASELRLERILTAQYGAAETAQFMTGMRAHARDRLLQVVAEVRGAPRIRGEGDESMAWGECTRREARARALGTRPVEAIIAATRQACIAEERATRAASLRTDGEAAAEQLIAALLNSMDSTVRGIVAEVRGGGH
jgi:hypothetical protein